MLAAGADPWIGGDQSAMSEAFGGMPGQGWKGLQSHSGAPPPSTDAASKLDSIGLLRQSAASEAFGRQVKAKKEFQDALRGILADLGYVSRAAMANG